MSETVEVCKSSLRTLLGSIPKSPRSAALLTARQSLEKALEAPPAEEEDGAFVYELIISSDKLRVAAPLISREIINETLRKIHPAVLDGDFEDLLIEELTTRLADEGLVTRPKQDVVDLLAKAGREGVVSLLEGVGIQCYDNESLETLIAAVMSNIADGTIEEYMLDELQED